MFEQHAIAMQWSRKYIFQFTLCFTDGDLIKLVKTRPLNLENE